MFLTIQISSAVTIVLKSIQLINCPVHVFNKQSLTEDMHVLDLKMLMTFQAAKST